MISVISRWYVYIVISHIAYLHGPSCLISSLGGSWYGTLKQALQCKQADAILASSGSNLQNMHML